MYLRKLELKDAPLMLSWMHDEMVTKYLQTDFGSKTLSKCHFFIERSLKDTANMHLAIVSDEDEYMGTVSLKHIIDGSAEFAITVRSCAMGKGYSKYAMETIFDKGFDELNLKSIFWCVSPKNKRAIRFYDKNGYKHISPDSIKIGGGVQHGTDSQVSLVSHYKRGKEERNLRINSWSRQLNTDILFLRPAV